MDSLQLIVALLLATPIDELTIIAAGMVSAPIGRALNLGFVINRLHGGGAERVVCTLANHYVEKDLANVHILSLAGKRCFFPLDERVHLDAVWDTADIQGLRGFIKTRYAARQVQAWREENNLDGVISFLPRANFANILSYRGPRKNGESVLISQRNITTEIYPLGSLRGSLGRMMIRCLYNRADQIICNSPETATSLTVMGVNAPRPVIPNPQDLEGIRKMGNEGPSGIWRTQDKPRIIAVGRLIPQKGHDILLQALRRLKDDMDFECQIVGLGVLRAQLEQQVQRLGLSGHVHFAGWLDNPFAAMREADVFVLPSRWEGFGNVIVEAMALGLPIIATNCKGSPDWILQEGQSGLLVNSEDPLALYHGLRQINTDPELRQSLGEAAQKRAEDFAVERVGEEFLSLITIARSK